MDRLFSGPWTITRQTGDGKRIYVESDMARDNWNCCMCEIDSDDCNSEMAMANARLIAASPALLAACKAAMTVMRGSEYGGAPGTTDALTMLDAAIALVEGEFPK